MGQIEQMHEEFIRQQRKKDDWDFICSLILAHAAPTIAGLKPATLVAFSNTGRPLGRLWKAYGARFLQEVAPRVRLGYFEMGLDDGGVLALFYREDLLSRILNIRQNVCFLEKRGIDCSNPERCLKSIQTQFVGRFPHEIGILLGYPLDDVLGFIKYQGKKALFDGYWKVYRHPRTAATVFRCFEQSKGIVYEYFLRKWEEKRMERLMENYSPRIISNREFVEYEEEDIQRINREEAMKFDNNPGLSDAMKEIESRLGKDGHWEEHWLTLDESGSRVYARIYYTPDEAVGIAADGRVVRTMDYPNDEENLLH